MSPLPLKTGEQERNYRERTWTEQAYHPAQERRHILALLAGMIVMFTLVAMVVTVASEWIAEATIVGRCHTTRLPASGVEDISRADCRPGDTLSKGRKN
jgi:hypothetical protein